MIDFPITVLMPVYNAEPFLREAIDSILNQTFKDFEFLIINDGSTDSSKEIILSYHDSRIRFIENESNMKLIATLNKGISLAKGKYIVRMDADDISMPERMEKLYEFMESNPDIGLCGTWFETFNNDGISPIVKYALDDTTIRLKQLYQIHLTHGTCIFRTSVLKDNALQFNAEFIHAEDYEMWTRIGKYSKFANIPFMLYRVRNNRESVSNKFKITQTENTQRITINQFKPLKPDFSNYDYELYCKFANAEFSWFDKQKVQNLDILLTVLFNANIPISGISLDDLKNYWTTNLFHVCYNTSNCLSIWRKSVFYDKTKLTFLKSIKSKMKNILKIN